MKPAVILVGADKGGVGKTTVSRVLLDYLAANNILTRAFDTESPRGTLNRFHPGLAEIVDISNASDQMRILDTLNSSGSKVSVVDVRAGQLGAVLRALRDIGFLEAAKNGEYAFLMFHVLGPSVSSLEEIEETVPFVADANYFLVKNYVNDSTFFEWNPQTLASYFKKVKSEGDVTIPKLNEMAYEQVELAGVSFSDFVANKNSEGQPADNSFVLRGYVRTWMRANTAELDRIGLVEILNSREAWVPERPLSTPPAAKPARK